MIITNQPTQTHQRPLALDLYCGIWEGGWANGLVAAGWDVIGVDIEDQGGYKGFKVLADVREIAKDVQAYFPALKFDLVVASPPCQEFSVSSQPFKRSRAKFNKDNPPDRSLWDAAVKIAKDLNAPLILENVRGAVPFMGKQTWNYGSYYFWGEMPALIPIPFMRENGIMSHRKGFKRSIPGSGNDPTGGYKSLPLDGKVYLGNAQASFAPARDIADSNISKARNGPQRSKHVFAGECERIDGVKSGLSRKFWAARVAMIPAELSEWIGKVFYPRNL
jgi:hypothetical protein